MRKRSAWGSSRACSSPRRSVSPRAGSSCPATSRFTSTGRYQLLGTVVAALVTYGCLKLAGRHLLIYGRRTLVLAVLLGFIFGRLTTHIPTFGLASVEGALTAIGFIIPGLLAYWMTRQGIVQTLAAMCVAAVLVRLALIVLHGGALLETRLL